MEASGEVNNCTIMQRPRLHACREGINTRRVQYCHRALCDYYGLNSGGGKQETVVHCCREVPDTASARESGDDHE